MHRVDEKRIDELKRLERVDREMRSRLLEEGRLYGRYDSEMQEIHRQNARDLAAMVEADGWPGLSQVGEEGARLAWIIAQHSICTPELQRFFLHHLQRAVRDGEASAEQAARLEDRIRFNEGRPQVYGTVFDWTRDGELGCLVEDSASVDVRRAEVGLPPFESVLAEQRRSVRAEGGHPPEDFESYQEQAAAWARSVGWR